MVEAGCGRNWVSFLFLFESVLGDLLETKQREREREPNVAADRKA